MTSWDECVWVTGFKSWKVTGMEHRISLPQNVIFFKQLSPSLSVKKLKFQRWKKQKKIDQVSRAQKNFHSGEKVETFAFILSTTIAEKEAKDTFCHRSQIFNVYLIFRSQVEPKSFWKNQLGRFFGVHGWENSTGVVFTPHNPGSSTAKCWSFSPFSSFLFYFAW